MARYEKVEICAAFGYELAPNEVSSDEIERRLKPLYDRLKLSVGRLELMTGIKTRRFWNRGAKVSSLAARAGKIALEKSKIAPARVGALINGSVCRDYLEPSTASIVAEKLKLGPSVSLFDISNACLGALNAALVIADMIELGRIEIGLVCAAEIGEALVDETIDWLNRTENLTRADLKSSFASLTIGSGSVAIALAREGVLDDSAPRAKLLGSMSMADPASSRLCLSEGDRGFNSDPRPLMNSDSEKLLIAGCRLANRTWGAFLDEIGWSRDQIDRIITHQVGAAHRKALYEAIGEDPAKDYETVSRLGNIGSVSAPLTLALAAENRFVNPTDKVALLGIGSGLSSTMLAIEWRG